ncbi:MAG: hypothetical protein NC915_05610 [Candidatus Omnitrophica bacterium]|nr:hypothetical protein [Candidatus Omnitrophota bacterium]
MLEIYKSVLKFKKEEYFLFFIIFFYGLLKNLFSGKFASLYFLIFILEIYLTTAVYSGIKKSIYEEEFYFFDIFKYGLHYFPRILLYNLFISFSAGLIYLITTGLINSIKIFSAYSIFLFILIISWAALPLFFLLLTIYTPFIIMIENETVFGSLNKSVSFIRENLVHLIFLFFPFLIFWSLFFTIFHKYDKIFLLKFIVIFLISFLEILTVKLVFLIYKGAKK